MVVPIADMVASRSKRCRWRRRCRGRVRGGDRGHGDGGQGGVRGGDGGRGGVRGGGAAVVIENAVKNLKTSKTLLKSETNGRGLPPVIINLCSIIPQVTSSSNRLAGPTGLAEIA